jgi:hypothetical protein
VLSFPQVLVLRVLVQAPELEQVLKLELEPVVQAAAVDVHLFLFCCQKISF